MLGKNPDGSERLGGYLTDHKVLRIIREANGHENLGSADDKLAKDELSVVAKHTKMISRRLQPEDAWKISIGKKLYSSETERNTSTMTDKTATKNFLLMYRVKSKIFRIKRFFRYYIYFAWTREFSKWSD